MEQIRTAVSQPDRRRTIEYLRRKARSVELQATCAAPAIATQLKSLAVSMQIEAEHLERTAAV